MKITSFDRQNIKSTIRPALEKALAQVVKELGVNITVGTARFTDQTMTIKVEMATNFKGGTTSKMEIDFLKGTAVHGVPADRLNRTFNSMGTVYTLKGYKPARWRYPFVCQGRNGKQYKVSATTVKNGVWID
jgi:hypothetical protein